MPLIADVHVHFPIAGDQAPAKRSGVAELAGTPPGAAAANKVENPIRPTCAAGETRKCKLIETGVFTV